MQWARPWANDAMGKAQECKVPCARWSDKCTVQQCASLIKLVLSGGRRWADTAVRSPAAETAVCSSKQAGMKLERLSGKGLREVRSAPLSLCRLAVSWENLGGVQRIFQLGNPRIISFPFPGFFSRCLRPLSESLMVMMLRMRTKTCCSSTWPCFPRHLRTRMRSLCLWPPL